MSPSEPKLFGPLLRSKRLLAGKQLVKFAKECGIDPGLYSRFETGRRPPPDLPVLVTLAENLGIPRESEEFSELLAAADHDQNPAAHKLALEMHGGKLWNPFASLRQNDVICKTVSELVSKAMQKAIDVQATAIVVKSPSGRTATFKLQEGNPTPSRAKRKQA